MKDTLKSRLGALEVKFRRLEDMVTETCSYCGVKLARGNTWLTGESCMYGSPNFEFEKRACRICLAKFERQCRAAKTGYENMEKAKREK